MAIISDLTQISKTGISFTIPSPRATDAADILTLARAVASEGEFHVTEVDEFTMTLEQEVEWIEQINARPFELALVAECQGKVVGFLDFQCGKRRRLARTGGFGMSVMRDYRDQGIGTALIKAPLDWARRSDQIEKVSLAVFATNERAIAVYKKLGFIEEGRRRKEVKIAPGKYVDDILMYQWVK